MTFEEAFDMELELRRKAIEASRAALLPGGSNGFVERQITLAARYSAAAHNAREVQLWIKQGMDCV